MTKISQLQYLKKTIKSIIYVMMNGKVGRFVSAATE